MPEQFTILGGKVHVYKRSNGSHWQCSSYFAGTNRRTSTKEPVIAKNLAPGVVFSGGIQKLYEATRKRAHEPK